eukprot:1467282-Alexandrium_andersonii.AAC.1
MCIRDRSCSEQRDVLLHERTLELDSAATPRHDRQSARSTGASGERPPHLRVLEAPTGLEQHAVAQATT